MVPVFGLFAAIRIGCGLLFVAAGGSKVRRVASVRQTLRNYALLPPAATRVLAPLLGPVEIVVGLLLVLSPWSPALAAARLGALALLVLFSGAIASALYRGIRIPCGCGLLLGDHVITGVTLLRNLALLTMLSLDVVLFP